MAFKNLFKKIKTTVGYDAYIRDKARSFATTHHLSAFRQIVSTFETNIPFSLVEREENGNLYFDVVPTEGIAFLRTSSSGTPTTTADLFKWLDFGTSVRHAELPNTFRNETFPNSLRTTHQDYVRKDIYVARKIEYDGLDARNYSQLVRELYEDEFQSSTKASLFDFIKSRFG